MIVCLQIQASQQSMLFEILSSNFSADSFVSLSALFSPQIIILASRFLWTENVEACLSRSTNSSLEEYKKMLMGEMKDVHMHLRGGNLHRIQRFQCSDYLILKMQLVESLDYFTKNKVYNCNDFEWRSQLRYCVCSGPSEQNVHHFENKCLVRIFDSMTPYGFEYFAPHAPYVSCMCTRKSFLSLAMALNKYDFVTVHSPTLCHGNYSAGKNETCRAMSRSMGKSFCVFSISDHVGLIFILNAIRGVSGSNMYGFFEIVHPVKSEMMSFLALALSEVHKIMLSAKIPKHIFPQSKMPSCGYFLSLTSPPQSIMQLQSCLQDIVRPVTIFVPELLLISETLLFSSGFTRYKSISAGLISFLTLLESHATEIGVYGQSLRNLVLIVRAAAFEISNARCPHEEGAIVNQINALFSSRFCKWNKNFFETCLSTFWPHVKPSEQEIDDEIKNILISRGLQPDNELIRCIQKFQNILYHKLGVIVVGGYGTGKSTIWRTLASYGWLTQDGSRSKIAWEAINPNAFTEEVLIGAWNKISEQWSCGALINLIRSNIAKHAATESMNWIVMDGEMNDWSIALRQILDENHCVRLGSNELLDCSKRIRLIFEVVNLEHACPSSICLCGVLFVDTYKPTAKMIVQSWIDALGCHSLQISLKALLEKYIEVIGGFFGSKEFRFLYHMDELTCSASMLRILDGLLNTNVRNSATNKLTPHQLETMVAFAFIWGFGGSLCTSSCIDGKGVFHRLWTDAFGTYGPLALPQDGTIFDFGPNILISDLQRWGSNPTAIRPTIPSEKSTIGSIIVTTSPHEYISYMLSLHTCLGSPILIFGNKGIGKTSSILNHCSGLPDTCHAAYICLNFYSDAEYLQSRMNMRLYQKAGNVVGPPGQQNILFFIDDISSPLQDKDQVRSTTALLLQYLEYSVWYDMVTQIPSRLFNVQYVAAANTPFYLTKHDVRLFRKLTNICYEDPDEQAVRAICISICDVVLQQFNPECQLCSAPIAFASAYIHQQCQILFSSHFSPPESAVNLRTLKDLFSGVSQAPADVYTSVPMMLSYWMQETRRIYVGPPKCEERIWRLCDTLKNGFQICAGAFDALDETVVHQTIHPMDPRTGVISPRVSLTSLRSFFEEQLDAYRNIYPTIGKQIIISDHTVEKLLEITRILKSKCHLILNGEMDVGQDQLLQLAGYCCGISIVTMSRHRNYNLHSFQADVESAILKAGKDRIDTVFFVKGSEILDDRFAALIQDFVVNDESRWNLGPSTAKSLSLQYPRSGTIWELSSEDIKSNSINEGVAIFSQAQTKLYFALSLTSKRIHTITRKFPSFKEHFCCVRFRSLENGQYYDIASKVLSEAALTVPIISNSCYEIAHHCVRVNTLVYENDLEMNLACRGEDPKSSLTDFLDFINHFLAVLSKQKTILTSNIEKESCIDLQFSNIERALEQAKIDGDELQCALQRQDESIAAILSLIGLKSREIEEQKVVLTEEEKNHQNIVAEVSSAKHKLQSILEQADPLFKTATDLVKDISKVELSEIRSLPNPPKGVELVFTAILALQKNQIDDTNWQSTKRALASIDRFIFDLVNVDIENISTETVEVLKPIVKRPEFVSDSLKRISPLSSSLRDFVLIVLEYHQVFTAEVKPLRHEIEEKEKVLVFHHTRVQDCLMLLDQMNMSNLRLHEELDSESRKKHKMLSIFRQTQASLDKSAVFFGHLGSFREAHSLDLLELQKKVNHCVGDALLASTLLTYCGKLRQFSRNNLINVCRNDLVTKQISFSDCSVVEVLADFVEICSWYYDGLPLPLFTFSSTWNVENISIAKYAPRCALLIDPNFQADGWSFYLERTQKARIVSSTDARYMNVIIESINSGVTAIIKGSIHANDFWTQTLLERRILQRGNKKYISVGTDSWELSSSMFLFILSEFDNESHGELFRAATIIDFTLSCDALHDYMLCLILAADKADLNRARINEIQTTIGCIHELELTRKQLEKQLLELNGCVQDPGKLVDICNYMQLVLNGRCQASNCLNQIKQIETSSKKYSASAIDLCNIWNCSQKLKDLSPSYLFSLPTAYNFVLRSIKQQSNSLDWCVDDLATVYTQRAFLQYILSGIFAQHKMPFLMHLFLAEQLQVRALDISASRLLLSRDVMPLAPLNMGCDTKVLTRNHLLRTFSKFSSKLSDVVASLETNYTSPLQGTSKPEIDLLQAFDLTDMELLFLLRIFRQDLVAIKLAKISCRRWSKCSSFGMDLQILMQDLLRTYCDDNESENLPALPVLFMYKDRSVESEIKIEEELMGIIYSSRNENKSLKILSTYDPNFTTSIREAGLKGERIFIKISNQESLGKVCDELEKFFNIYTSNKQYAQFQRGKVECAPPDFQPSFRMFISCTSLCFLPPSILCSSMRMSLDLPVGVKARDVSLSILLSQHRESNLQPVRQKRIQDFFNIYLQKLVRLHTALVHCSSFSSQMSGESSQWDIKDILRVQDDMLFITDGFQTEDPIVINSNLSNGLIISTFSVYGAMIHDHVASNLLFKELQNFFEDAKDGNGVIDETYRLVISNDVCPGTDRLPDLDSSETETVLCDKECEWESENFGILLSQVLCLQGARYNVLDLSNNLDILKTIVQEVKNSLNLLALDASALDLAVNNPSCTNIPVLCCLLTEIYMLNQLFLQILCNLQHIESVVLKDRVGNDGIDQCSHIQVAHDLVQRHVPYLWTRFTFPCDNGLGSWVEDVKRRREQVVCSRIYTVPNLGMVIFALFAGGGMGSDYSCSNTNCLDWTNM